MKKLSNWIIELLFTLSLNELESSLIQTFSVLQSSQLESYPIQSKKAL